MADPAAFRERQDLYASQLWVDPSRKRLEWRDEPNRLFAPGHESRTDCHFYHPVFGCMYELLYSIAGPRDRGEFDSRWLSCAVIDLATSIRDHIEYGKLPILGDALQDAYCDNKIILNHLYSTASKCRGDWVVEMICSGM
jgi:hypothetical protein